MEPYEITVIELCDPATCICCGDVSRRQGVPMYEDMVLPNDWPDEWAGYDACRRLYDWQGRLSKPALLRESPCAPTPAEQIDE